MLKAILFDWGGVLTKGRHTDAIIQLIDSKYNTKIVSERKFIGKLMDKMDSNILDFESFVKKVNNKFKINISVKEMDKLFKDAIRPANSELIDIIKKLQEKYRVVLASNNNAETVSIVRDIYKEFINIFEKTYFSFEIGFSKPDPNFFRFILKDMGIEEQNAIFIDDKLINVESATKIGIESIQFKSSDQIIKQLSKLL